MKKSTLSRRTVLKEMAAAAFGVPLVISSTALGDDQTPPASERVTRGHIGAGVRGTQVFEEFRACTGYQSVAVADAYADRRQTMATRCGGKAHADFRDLLARKDIDAVVVATPDHWHVPMAVAAARAGKDAYVEKPLGISIEQDLYCRKVFQEQKRIFQYGTQQRSSPHCHLGCELVRSGRIGKLERIEVIAPNGGVGGSTAEAPVPAELDYDLWLGPAPKASFTADRCHPQGTYWIYDYSIGYLGGWGAHPLDIMVWGSDADLSGLVTVEGTGMIPDKGLYDTVYNWNMQIQLGDVAMSFAHGGDSTKFIGTEGWVRIRRTGITAEPKSLLQSKIGPGDVHLVDSPNHWQNFIDAVKTRKQPVSTLGDAVRSDVISHLCDIAVRLNRKVTWDPTKEQIVGDAEAAARMHRDMRAPWRL
jgi:glucose-fructose oxidoreductase